ncbi:MAG: thioredoxin domain-containing protein [Candidatus Zhuqueibacterota bacterium]
MENYKYTNRLIHETSPYLLQHAHNPVDWYPWGEEAITLAKKENKVIFLSIGYSACHWCHVMEKESFENEETARLMNALFVCIKVDREERPDLDEIYMDAVQIMSGSGGWPLSVWLTPELEPIYGGTYFPPEERWGLPGFSQVLTMIADLWRERPGNALGGAASVKQALSHLHVLRKSDGDMGIDMWHRAFDAMSYRFDKTNGGFGKQPKFPHPMSIAFLLRYHFHTGNAGALEMAEKMLQAMALGGIFDHIGGGFHRYATDEKWRIPHFEKMLYDNALLSGVYLEAYQITRNEFYADIARAVLNYVLRDMTSPEGAFYSSQDADSEGEEGKFYAWQQGEIENILGKNDAAIVCGFYGVTRPGNWEGRNILYSPLSEQAYAESTGMDVNSLSELIARSRERLRTVRSGRIAPAKDDKIITSWNGLMISALCKGYQVLRESAYLDAAKKAVAFLLDKMYINSTILRSYRNRQRQAPGYLSDYANLTAALLDLYESSFEWVYLQRAIELNELILNKFWDVNEGGFFFTSSDHERLFV